MANWIIRGRQVIVLLTNESGGGVVNGDVVVIDDGDADSFTTTAVEGQSAECIGVAIETIAAAAEGRICIGGEVEQVNLDGAAVLRDWIKCDGVVKQATPQAAPGDGCFGQVLQAGATPAAIIWTHPIQPAGADPDAIHDNVAAEISAIANKAAPVNADYLIIEDSAAGDAKKHILIGALPAAGGGLDPSDYYGRNLIQNSPGQIVVDGAEPQWWDDSGSATLTDEDAAGEACSDLFERVFKLVTVSDDHYGFQTLTFADEELLDAGVTIVSFGCWVWCAAAATASIAIFGTNLGLQESAQHTGGSGWEWLTIENITLNGADVDIEARLIGDTGTAFFTGPMLSVGPEARVWVPRGIWFVPLLRITHYDLNTTGDVGWADTDLTANTDPLAVAGDFNVWIQEANGTVGSLHSVGHDDAITGGDTSVGASRVNIVGATIWENGGIHVFFDDQQVMRYLVDEADADNDVRAILYLTGYYMWAS